MNPQLDACCATCTRRQFLQLAPAVQPRRDRARRACSMRDARAGARTPPIRWPREAAALRPEGEARDLPAPVRLAAAPRPVRLQAGAGQARRPALPRRASSRASGSRSPRACPSCSARRRKFAQHGKAAPGCRTRSRTSHDVADELCFIKSMHTDQFNHAPAELLLYTGSPRQGRPSMGSWVTYGLGSENENLPGFVVLISSGVQPNGGKSSWGSGFLPSVYQGVQCRVEGRPGAVRLRPAPAWTATCAGRSLDALRDLNEMQARKDLGNPETADAHRPVRAGLPHADGRARGDGHLARVEGDARGLRRRAGRRRASPTTACWPGGWSRRACASCSCSTGAGTSTAPARARTSGRPDEEVRDDGPAGRGPDPGPEAARPARRHAGHLERRVRPHAVPRGPHRRQQHPRPRPLPGLLLRCSWPAAA